MEKGMMVSPKLVPLSSLCSCHWKVPGSLLSLWERMQLFKSKDLATAEVHGTRGSCLIGPTDSLRFGVSVPSKYIPACSSLAQSYCLIYNRDVVQLRTYQVRTYLGTNIPYKIRIIKSSQISYSSSKGICSILGNWYIVKTLAKNLTAIPAASTEQGVLCYPIISRCPFPSPLFLMC